jgi:hypothetical protein
MEIYATFDKEAPGRMKLGADLGGAINLLYTILLSYLFKLDFQSRFIESYEKELQILQCLYKKLFEIQF